MKVWPNALPSSGARARARMSVVPPGANGTTIRTGLLGQVAPACAKADPAKAPRQRARAAARRLILMGLSPASADPCGARPVRSVGEIGRRLFRDGFEGDGAVARTCNLGKFASDATPRPTRVRR